MTYMRAILREEGSPLFMVFFYLNKRNTIWGQRIFPVGNTIC